MFCLVEIVYISVFHFNDIENSSSALLISFHKPDLDWGLPNLCFRDVLNVYNVFVAICNRCVQLLVLDFITLLNNVIF